MAKKAKQAASERKEKPARAALERNSKKILKRLEQDGWKIVKAEGSHHKLRNPKFSHPIILVHPKKDLPTGTARQIAKDAGWL